MKCRNPFATILLILIAAILFQIFGYPYRLTFNSSFLNYTVVALAGFALPIAFLYGASIYSNLFKNLSLFIMFFLIGIPSGLIGIVTVFEAISVYKEGHDSSYILLDEVPLNGAFYRLYRQRCGATCRNSLNLRKEISMPIGMKFVKSVWFDYSDGEGRATLKVLDGGSVLIEYEGGVYWIRE